MAVFNYVAKDIQGEYHRGEVDTVDVNEAARLLRRKKLVVVSLKNAEQSGMKWIDHYFNKVPYSQVVIMTRQLATMTEAGLVISDSLDLLADQQTNKYFKKVLVEVANDVKGGLELGSALEKHPDVFPRLYINLVRAGEISGKLDVILLQLATNLEKEREFHNKVRGAMIYPAIVISMMGVVMLVMTIFVIPRLTSLYTQSNIELPLPTKIMIGFADLITGYWWLILMIIATAALIFHRWVSTPEGKMSFQVLLLKIPVIGHIISLVILTNFTRTLALLVAAGIPILETIQILSNVVGNVVYQKALLGAYKGVERGLTFSNQILSYPIFPKIVGQMIRTGEETGKLDEVMEKLSTYFESESDNSLKNITTLIEPAVLVILGLGVAFLVLSIILPIYKLTTSIQ